MSAVRILLAAALLTPGAAWAQHTGHEGHDMGGMAMDHAMPAPDKPPVPAPNAPAPAAPSDHAADAYYDPAVMARARRALAHESGGMAMSMLLVDWLEWRPGEGRDGYAWKGEGWIGGDIDRIVVKSEGEGRRGDRLEQGEVQLLWSHATDPWFNVQAGVRQDFGQGPDRTHAVIGVEGLAPYWFHVDGQMFLSTRGEVTARAEASYDQRISQRLILQPAAELNLSAQSVRALALGDGVTSIELGARLRYEVRREFAPYIGVHWERKLGETARLARAEGEDADTLRMVAGVRFWF